MSPTNRHPTLQGCRIALTIAADAPHSPADHLRKLEADLLFYPVAQMLPPDSYDELDAVLQRCRLGEIDWLLLTTPRTVEAVKERMTQLAFGPAEMSSVKLAIYGAMTRLTLAERFPTWESALPHFDTHQQLVDAMQLGPNQAVALPLAIRSRADWPDLVRAGQAEVITAPAYRLLLGRGGDDLPGLLWGGIVDAVVFLTENNVRHFITRLNMEGGTPAMLDHVVVAALDPQTAAAARAFGLHVQVLPTSYTFAALATAIAQYFSTEAVEA
jgi:uroporphyrinogen III methyltransferase / synthase